MTPAYLTLSHPLGVALAAAVAAALSYGLTPLAARIAIRVGALDVPDARKVHLRPTPRFGGLAVIGAATLALAVLTILPSGLHEPLTIDILRAMALGLLPILAISVWDDVRPLAAGLRFFFHFAGAAIAVTLGIVLSPTVHVFGIPLHIGWAALPLSVFWLMLGTNAFNLIDGLDGLSAGLGLISAAALVGVFVIAERAEMAVLAMVIAGAIFGFLPHNVHPARVFLGDTGATAIGFSLACMALVGGARMSSGLAVAMPIFLLALPIADTAIAVARRTLARAGGGDGSDAVFTADRNHIHHRLIAMGITHASAVWILWTAGAVCAAVGLASVLVNSQRAGLLLTGLFAAGSIGFARLGYNEFALIKKGVILRFYDAPVLHRSMFAVFADLGIVALSAYVAIGLQQADWGLVDYRDVFLSLVSSIGPATILAIWLAGLYRGSWRLAGLTDFVRLAQAIVGAAFVGYLVATFIWGRDIHLSLVVIVALVLLTTSVAARLSYRVLLEARTHTSVSGTPVVLYGAGLGGVTALRELRSNVSLGMLPVAFLDDDPAKWGRVIQGVAVRGGIEALPDVLASAGATRVLIATKKIAPDRLASLAAACEAAGVSASFIGVVVEPLSSTGAAPKLC